MDLMKKVLLTGWLMVLLTGFVGAQEIRMVSTDEAADALRRLQANALYTIEEYYYYMQGVDPVHTSAALDEAIARAQDALITFEQYTLRRPSLKPDLRRIDGYWANIRTRCVHTPRLHAEKILLEHYDDLDRAVEALLKKVDKSSAATSERDFIAQYLKKIHYLSLLFILYERTGEESFKTLLEANTLELRSLNNRLLLWMERDGRFEGKRRDEIIATVRTFLHEIMRPHADPEKVYESVNRIEQLLG